MYFKKINEELNIIKVNNQKLIELDIASFIFSILIKIVYADLKKLGQDKDKTLIYTEVLVSSIIN